MKAINIVAGYSHQAFWRLVLRVKLLRGCYSGYGFIDVLSMERVVRDVMLMYFLPRLRDPQSELLIHQSCMSITMLFFWPKDVLTDQMDETSILFDKELQRGVEDIMVGIISFIENFQ